MLPSVDTGLVQQLGRNRRCGPYIALLLSVIVPRPVSGGAICAEIGRLYFCRPEAREDKDAAEAAPNALIARDLPVIGPRGRARRRKGARQDDLGGAPAQRGTISALSVSGLAQPWSSCTLPAASISHAADGQGRMTR
ncbi:hypothetical protein [Rhodovulum sp. MB263]|uniref:hypothetical protein n=1 Tax=Rhodovulum sp. (strain MB263) TaxID=308754 RepID=UPI0009B7C111|nr:hypothetical protein [Rhodovulum sp. MB263]ARC89032.1 hypothetical protein B5V46_10615 [Rhodovulum sp. MB263]